MSYNGPMSDISDTSHSLLEPRSPAYTNVTVRRAFVVWMYCGQRNKFKDVCNYFHHLEALEDQLSPEGRALSRQHEFNLFSNQPPTSTYLINNFPRLYEYKENNMQKHYESEEEVRNEKCVFKLEGFNEMTPKHGTTTHEILETSRLIRKYCRIQMVSLKKFLEEFKEHARKCDLKYTVNNVAFYIARKMVQAEIELEAKYPKTLSFLNNTSVENTFNDIQNTTIKDDCILNDWKGTSSCGEEEKIKPIKILRKDMESDDMAKNYRNITNCNGKNPQMLNNIDVNKVIFKDESFKINNIEPLITEDIKSIPVEDLKDENTPIKKERRFSGSRFMKVELEKFRKI